MNDFIGFVFRLDHWTRKPLLFVAFPLAVVGMLPGAVREGRLFAFDFWDFQYRMWWVCWDGTLIGKNNATRW